MPPPALPGANPFRRAPVYNRNLSAAMPALAAPAVAPKYDPRPPQNLYAAGQRAVTMRESFGQGSSRGAFGGIPLDTTTRVPVGKSKGWGAQPIDNSLIDPRLMGEDGAPPDKETRAVKGKRRVGAAPSVAGMAKGGSESEASDGEADRVSSAPPVNTTGLALPPGTVTRRVDTRPPTSDVRARGNLFGSFWVFSYNT